MAKRDTSEDLAREIEEERRLRRARVVAATGQVPEQAEPAADSPADSPAVSPAVSPADSREDEEDVAAKRMEQRTLWVEMQVRTAMERGDFDDLPGAGKPIKGLGSTHDPDWWVKNLVERERITGVLPPALALRKEDAELGDVLDRETTEDGIRRVVADFNRRVVEARRQLQGGPPVITPTRDAEAEVAAWRVRRAERRERQRAQLEATATASDVPPGGRAGGRVGGRAGGRVGGRRRWWHRNR